MGLSLALDGPSVSAKGLTDPPQHGGENPSTALFGRSPSSFRGGLPRGGLTMPNDVRRKKTRRSMLLLI